MMTLNLYISLSITFIVFGNMLLSKLEWFIFMNIFSLHRSNTKQQLVTVISKENEYYTRYTKSNYIYNTTYTTRTNMHHITTHISLQKTNTVGTES